MNAAITPATVLQFHSAKPGFFEFTFTPQIAQDILSFCNDGNRAFRKTKIRLYTNDMVSGDWKTAQPIMFDRIGRLQDGQNRLAAVVASGCNVKMNVLVGQDPESYRVMDNGAIRTTADVAPEWVNRKTVETSRAMWRYFDLDPAHRPTRAGELSFIDQHRGALEFTASLFTQNARGVAAASVRGAVARAFYHVPEKTLAEFVARMYSLDFGPDGDGNIRLLCRFIISGSTRSKGAGSQKEMFCKTERALLAFWKQEQMARLYASPVELFPLPEEAATEIAA